MHALSFRCDHIAPATRVELSCMGAMIMQIDAFYTVGENAEK